MPAKLGRDHNWSIKLKYKNHWLGFAIVASLLLVGRSNAVDVVECFPIQGLNTIDGVCIWQGNLYAATKNNILQKYDLASGKLLESISPLIPDLELAHVHGMTRGADGTFWVGEMMTRKLYQIRFDDYSLVTIIDAPETPETATFGLSFSNDILWVGHHSEGLQTPVRGLDPVTGEIVEELDFEIYDNHGLVWLGGYLWALDNSRNSILKVRGGNVIEEILVLPEQGYSSLAFDGRLFWTNNSEAFLTINIPESPPCPADIDGNGTVSTNDLLGLLSAWGTDPGGPPDFDSNGLVGTSDLLILLSSWGPCK